MGQTSADPAIFPSPPQVPVRVPAEPPFEAGRKRAPVFGQESLYPLEVMQSQAVHAEQPVGAARGELRNRPDTVEHQNVAHWPERRNGFIFLHGSLPKVPVHFRPERYGSPAAPQPSRDDPSTAMEVNIIRLLTREIDG